MIFRADGETNGAPGDILNTAYSEGWLEAQDISGAYNYIKRSDAARILHMFLLKVKDIKEIQVYIKPAENAVYYVVNSTETGKLEV